MNTDTHDTQGAATQPQLAQPHLAQPRLALADAGWQKSRRSNSQGACVELARLADGGIAVRNSRFPDGPVLRYTRSEIRALLDGVKEGDFDHLLR